MTTYPKHLCWKFLWNLSTSFKVAGLFIGSSLSFLWVDLLWQHIFLEIYFPCSISSLQHIYSATYIPCNISCMQHIWKVAVVQFCHKPVLCPPDPTAEQQHRQHTCSCKGELWWKATSIWCKASKNWTSVSWDTSDILQEETPNFVDKTTNTDILSEEGRVKGKKVRKQCGGRGKGEDKLPKQSMSLLHRMPLFSRHCGIISKVKVSCHHWWEKYGVKQIEMSRHRV